MPSPIRALLALSLVGAAGAHAQNTVLWDGEEGDLRWFSDANWDPDGVPDSNSNVVLATSSTVTASTTPIEVISILSPGGGLELTTSNLSLQASSQINDLTVGGGTVREISIGSGVLTLTGSALFEQRPRFEGFGEVEVLDNALFESGLIADTLLRISGFARFEPGLSAFAQTGDVVVEGTAELAPNATTSSASGFRWEIDGGTLRNATDLAMNPVSFINAQTLLQDGTLLCVGGELRCTGPIEARGDSTFEVRNGGTLDLNTTEIEFRDGVRFTGEGTIDLRSGNMMYLGLFNTAGSDVVGGPNGHGLRLRTDLTVGDSETLFSTGDLGLGPGDLVGNGAIFVDGGAARTDSGFRTEGFVFVRGGTLTISHVVDIVGTMGVSGGKIELRQGAATISSATNPNFSQEFIGALALGEGVIEMPADLPETTIVSVGSEFYTETNAGTLRVLSGWLQLRDDVVLRGGEIDFGGLGQGRFSLFGGAATTVSVDGDVTATGTGVFDIGGGTSGAQPIVEIAESATLRVSVGNDPLAEPATALRTTVRGSGTLWNDGILRLMNGARVEATIVNAGLAENPGQAFVSGHFLNNANVYHINSFIMSGGTITNTALWYSDRSGAQVSNDSGIFNNLGIYRVEGPGPGRISHTISSRFSNTGTLSASNATVSVLFCEQVDENGVVTGGAWVRGPNSVIRFPTDLSALEGPDTRVDASDDGTPEANEIGSIDEGAELRATDDLTLDPAGGTPVSVEAGGRLTVEGGTTCVPGLETREGGSVGVAPGATLDSSAPGRVGEEPTKLPSVVDEIEGVLQIALLARGESVAPPTVAAPLVELYGRLIPGGDGGIAPFRFEAPLTAFPSATWRFDLDAPGAHDTVHATGEVTLDGTLELTVFTEPAIGDAFTIISSDTGFSGSFDAVEVVGVPGVRFNVVTDATSVTVVAACPPDLAEPVGTLNFNDVIAFLTAFSNGDPAADFTEPVGVLNFNDVLAFLNSFASGCP